MTDQIEQFTADVLTTKTFLVKGEVTYAVQGEFRDTTPQGAEAQFKKRVREENTTHIKVVSVERKPSEPEWEGHPPGSPLRRIQKPDMPLTPPPPARKKNTKKPPTP